MTTFRRSSSLSGSIRPLRSLFLETHGNGNVHYQCKLCYFTYSEENRYTSLGWATTVDGLFTLVKHMKGHQHS